MPLADSSSPRCTSEDRLGENEKINVLVCTANIGNEEPNLRSIREWIPSDGETKSVLQNQPYPVKSSAEIERHWAGTRDNSGWQRLPETFNNNEKKKESDIRFDDKSQRFHIIAIGMQEATFEQKKSPVLLQKINQVTTVVEQATKDSNYNEEPKSYFGNVFSELRAKSKKISTPKHGNDGSGENEDDHIHYHKGNHDTNTLHQLLSDQLPSYTRAVSYQRGQMRLMIFFDEDEISLNVLSVKAQNTGRGGLANKGGIVAECDVNSGTRISFLTAHLEAHEGLAKYNTRCSTVSDIFEGTKSNHKDLDCDVSMTSHFTFAMGDLNFRTRLPNFEMGSDEHVRAAHSLAERKDWDAINEHDELSLALRNKECFARFLTPKCYFPPTFKIQRAEGYNYVSNRSPSYTDRILYKSNNNLSQMICLQAYGPVDNFTTSDHKPMRGAFKIQLNKNLCFRPILMTRPCTRSLKLKARRKEFLECKEKLKVRSDILHFSISSIGCKINEDVLLGSLQKPRACISFIPTPTDAIKTNDLSRSWKKYLRNNKAVARFAMKWPHTLVIPNSLNPQKTNDVNFKIRSHFKCGGPIDLTGAMLHVLVHDTKDNFCFIGSYTLNLAALIQDCIAKKKEMVEQSVFSNLKETRRTSLRIFATRMVKASRSNSSPENPESDENYASQSARETDSSRLWTTTNQFNEVLMRNSKEVGHIKFNISARWISHDDFSIESQFLELN
mmetsp:Transcript_17179/g.39684  ORF Transcript_17179/g.39684 Transcript_17179/m.39684 type:complete len:727 (-) Transcript_17179:40-2220(-)